MKESIVHIKSQKFSARITNMHRYLKSKKVPGPLCDQLLRSGTSVGANLAEATYGLSKKDFLFKISIALRECNETSHWIENLFRSRYITKKQFDSIKGDCDEIGRILTKIVKTTKSNLDNQSQ